MSKKAWSGVFNQATDAKVEQFTESISFDRRLYAHDVKASVAHAQMLAKVGLISDDECRQIEQGLSEIRREIEQGSFPFSIELEDIHLHIERALVERIGDTGRKLHTARSRNDQVSTDLRLWCRDAIDQLDAALRGVQCAFVDRCAADKDVVVPGYTHMQRAQPVLAAHYWLAYCEKLQRDRERLADCRRRVNVLPLGAAALAGTTLPIDRHDVARRLEFVDEHGEPQLMANSLDASSDRDFVVETAFALAMIAEHLSGWAEEWILWSTAEFNFLKLPETFCTGSSIMPQKINPDVLELVRGKTARVIGNLQALLVLVKGLPLAYNRDLQEDKQRLFDSVDTVQASLEIAAPLVQGTKLNQAAIAEKLDRGYLDATTLMEELIRRGMPQRTAHEVVGKLVRKAMDRSVRLADLTADDFKQVDATLDDSVRSALGVENAVARFVSYGSTAPAEVNKQIQAWQERLSAEAKAQEDAESGKSEDEEYGTEQETEGREQMKRLLRFFAAGLMVMGIAVRPALSQNSAMLTKADPAVDTIVDSNPHTPGQLIQAAVVLADLDRVDLAKKYLQQLAAAKPNEEALAEAATEVEPATLLRLADNMALQPEGGQLAAAVLAAAAHVTSDPARIQKEIDQLADPSRSVRRTALRKILAAHEDAVPELVAALKDGNREAVHPLVRTALVELGEQAVQPLVAALESDNDKLKLQVIDVLRQIGSRDAVAYLALPATVEGNSSEIQAAARAALRDIAGSKNPTAGDAKTLLVAEIDRYLKHDQLLKRDANGTIEVWRWDAKAGTLVRENLPPDLAYPTLANRLAADLLELSPEDSVAKRLYLVSGLETAARRAGLDQPLVNDDPAVAKANEMGAAAVEDALLMAIANDNYPAATAAVQVLGNTGERSLLEARDGHFSPLVYAVSQGDRRLRFAAAEAMMKLKPASAFAGSSDLMTALAMFADSPGGHRALVAFPNSVVAGQLAAMLTSLGFDVDIALNSRQAFLKGISSGDYELILLSSRLDHPPVWVILPELRHNPVTAYTPVALLAEDTEDDLARMQTLAADNSLTTALARPVTTEGMKFLVDRTIARAGTEFVPADVRLRQALAATEWLKQLNTVLPREFDLIPFEKQITRMLSRPATSTAAAEMLAAIGKQTAQEALVALADTATQPLEMRQTAATAFSEAVRKHGIQLTTKEIVHQYGRYNQSETEDRETQQLLGLILDAIELPTAKK